MSARVLIAWLILACAHTSAANRTDWEAGGESFESGDYESALGYFQSARDAGLGGPAVHYNIAVCRFKLEQFEEAATEFRRIARQFPKMRGLAEYNLGLIARRNSDNETARQHFLNAYENSPGNRNLRILASARLRELEPDRSRFTTWSGAVGMRAGFDDNVILRDEAGLPAGTTTESPVLDFFASIQGPWDQADGLRFEASLYAIRNLDADEFDQTELFGGTLYDWRRNDWLLQGGVHISLGTLGGDAFDRKLGASVRAVRDLGDNGTLRLSYVYDDVHDEDALFAGVSGSRQRLRARYRWHSGSHGLGLSYRWEANDRSDPGISPTRHEMAAEYRYQPDEGWGYESGIKIRSSDFDDLPSSRSEDLVSIHVALTRPLNDGWLAILDYRFSDNNSSDPDFSYDRQQLSLGVVRSF